jgi:hypothetical protein
MQEEQRLSVGIARLLVVDVRLADLDPAHRHLSFTAGG